MRGKTFRRREILGLFCALAVPVVRAGAQRQERLFDVALLDHINIRASNPTRSAHFYQSLFGGNLLWIESIRRRHPSFSIFDRSARYTHAACRIEKQLQAKNQGTLNAVSSPL
jgi:hypothetical protein